MLVVSRKPSETVLIGDDIEIEVLEIRGNKCRLGITAPKELPIYRSEVWAAVHREKESA